MLADVFTKIIMAYEAAKAPRTISAEEFEKYEWHMENYGSRDALATLGITVGD